MKNHSKVICLKTTLLLILIISFQANIQAQPSPVWGDLKPGEYAAGFKTIERYDYSRTFRSHYGYFGEAIPGENSRPIQICIWYPAQKTENAVSMVLGEYAFPFPEDMDFFQIVTATQQRELQRLTGLLGNNRGAMLDASNIEMCAIGNAPPAEGKFPLIVYFPDLMNSISDNFVLCEYLASNGFVVLTTHMVGTGGLNPGINQIDLETVVRDKEFALAKIHDIDFINMDKIGTFGVGGGGLASLILQMRNYNIEAVASLAGWNIVTEQIEFVKENPHYSVNRMAKPLLQIYYEDNEIFNLDLVDSLKYAARYMIKLDKIPEGGFSSYPTIRSYMDSLNVTKVISRPNYDLTAKYLLEFYNFYLKKDEIEFSFVDDNTGYEFKKGMELPPTSDQFVGIIRSQGGVKAVELYNKFEKSDPGSITFPEATINFVGYQAMQEGSNENAIALFKLNADTYPNSANVWDSYSDGLQVIGDVAGAINCYKKVLEVLPLDSLIDDGLKETLRTNAEAGIERLSNESN
ncbi:MAG: hypothetical protein GY865_17105 [candidate division Zixibacteria bacterium]|nr:hypothetical protein [candidate division Zixibacteria bacterium]